MRNRVDKASYPLTSFSRRRIPHGGRILQVKAAAKFSEVLRSGAVAPILPKDAASAMESQGYRLLDVRPPWEWERARVPGSLHVPLFVEDEDGGPLTLLKKWVHFGYIGLWSGQPLTAENPAFLRRVGEAASSKESRLLVACGDGLRSRMAVEKLYGDGYVNLGWLAGGFGRAADGDFPMVEGGEKKLRYAAVGGVSYYLLKLILLLQPPATGDGGK